MELAGHTTVKELVAKHASMKQKMDEIYSALKQMQGRDYHDTEILDRAIKDKRYAVQLLLHEYNRLKVDLEYLEDLPVRYLND
jgi:uncharacterized protein YaaN involved in tellurite resistance